MYLVGTLINVVAILIGGVIGILFGSRLPDRIKSTITAGLGLFTAMIGIKMFLKTNQELVVLASLLLGGLLGEWWRIEDRLRSLGAWLERRFLNKKADSPIIPEGDSQNILMDRSNRFIRGFMTASLVFAIGPIAILGSIQDGLTGNYNLLAIKSMLDLFASIAFAASLGVGVLFSSIIILVYQGSITLLAAQVQAIVSEPMMNEMTAVGGVLLLGIAISSLLEIKPIRVGNFLPALFIAPIIMAFIK
jgi:uncharacterized membrane protein YqgA involved in biofilm formation